jgi:DNA-binding phage protein
MTAQAEPKRGVGKISLKKTSSAASLQVELFAIAVEMKKSGLADAFIVNAVRIALNLNGASDLMHLWAKESDNEERDEIIADLQDLIDASEQKNKVEEMYIKFNDLESISKDIRGFKDTLYQEVVKRGGVSKLSELTGIPQPSLSRFFNSNSMPRRSTVLAIAKALDLSGIAMDVKWSK